MPSIYALKPKFQAFLKPCCRALIWAGVTPNQLTVAAILLSLVEGAWIASAPGSVWPLYALPVVLSARMALNALDGMLARERRMQSRLGAMLNELGDLASDALLYPPLALHAGVPAWGVIGVVLLGALAEMAGVTACQIGSQRRYDGPFGKSDRAAAFGILAVALAAGFCGMWVAYYLVAAILLSAATVVNRAHKAVGQGESA